MEGYNIPHAREMKFKVATIWVLASSENGFYALKFFFYIMKFEPIPTLLSVTLGLYITASLSFDLSMCDYKRNGHPGNQIKLGDGNSYHEK